MIKRGYVYAAMPPLYKAMPSKGEEEYLYDDKALERYRKRHKGPFTLQRYKGLGEMDAVQLWETTLNPETRILKQVEIEDARMASRGRRAYLFAFRVREGFQGRGYGTHLMKTVLAALSEDGYSEFTIGVEDDNQRAARLYQAFGFTELIARKQEAYQGDAYEYGLYLKK